MAEEVSSNSEQVKALKQVVGRLLVDRSNLIGTDFADVSASKTEREFPQDTGGGVLIQFAVSHHAIGKLGDPSLADALKTMGYDE